ncbi:glycine oxidase ThiO [Almyronema epifaneia]|uniref:Thiazole synthase n=1 Tax=Almyronema epifaneia S1 TaxID=2991925 RepID=A0ABW6IB22_9CYAN
MGGTSDVLVIGGGLMGLAIAVDLQQQGATVTVLSRDFQAAAGHAAAGMLAPQAEELPPGPLQTLCQRSLALYPDWVEKLEALTGQTVGYWPCGILAPQFTLPANPTGAATAPRYWLDRSDLQQFQPGLSEQLVGGWWFPEEGQVDNRLLMQTLSMAAQTLGVDLQTGVTVKGIQQRDRQVTQVITSVGSFRAHHYVLAAGAWARELLPLPVFPCKGQMLSLKVPSGYPQPQPLGQILYGEQIYIVPRQGGQIVLGATVETVGFNPNNTAAGIQQLLAQAIRLYPELQSFPIQECWWGFRPTTPDELPILGASPCQNLTLALGHHRNGILLAPITATLIGRLIQQQVADPLLSAFAWDRFCSDQSSTAALLTLPATPATPMQLADRPLSDPNLSTSDTPLKIAGRSFKSRLMTGTGKFDNFDDMRHSLAASGSEIVTVAVRRVQTNAPGHEGLAEALDWKQIWMLPNTAGCQSAEEAVRVAKLGREMAKLLGQEDNNFVKLEVIPDAKYLLPDPIGTLQAAEQLVREGFAVLPYINADPLLAKRLEEIGCVTVMPLGSPIGSGQGIRNAANIEIIIENAQVPVVVDAGIGSPSEAAQAMEMGADALLINTAIAKAKNPIAMGKAMGMATAAGRLAYLAGRIPVKTYASASSPLSGRINS